MVILLRREALSIESSAWFSQYDCPIAVDLPQKWKSSRIGSPIGHLQQLGFIVVTVICSPSPVVAGSISTGGGAIASVSKKSSDVGSGVTACVRLLDTEAHPLCGFAGAALPERPRRATLPIIAFRANTAHFACNLSS